VWNDEKNGIVEIVILMNVKDISKRAMFNESILGSR
jgi:hypothetical protein